MSDGTQTLTAARGIAGIYRTALAGALGLALLAFAAAGAPAAVSAECPNEEIRQQQGSTYLGACRAYELVNVPETNQQQTPFAKLSGDGERVFYVIAGGSPLSVAGLSAQVLAERGQDGWESRNLLPPVGEYIGESYLFNAAAPDLSGFVFSAFTGSPSSAVDATVVQLDDRRNQTVLYEPQVFDAFLQSAPSVGAADDLSHIYTLVSEPISPDHPAGKSAVYDLAADPPRMESYLPGNQTPACGVSGGNTDGFISPPTGPISRQHRVSPDGSRFFFVSRGDVCTHPKRLYRRDVDAGETVQVSGPVVSGNDLGIERFIQAAADGSWAIYRSRTSYDPEDTNTTSDVYRWSDGPGRGSNQCLTCAVGQAEVLAPDAGSASWINAIASEDGSYVYFLSKRMLEGKGVEGETNLYLLHGGSIHYVGPFQSIPTTGRGSGLGLAPGAGSALSADGTTLVFRNAAAGLDPLSGSDNGGYLQLYRYDGDEHTLTCVSCPLSGSPTADVQRNLAEDDFTGSPISDDGETVVFSSPDALLPRDVNRSEDLYEWHDGRLSLITDGTTETSGELRPRLMTVSGDGREVLFSTYGHLVERAVVGTMNLFVARVGGGFPPPPSPPAGCEGEACRGLPLVTATPPAAATAGVRSAGNVRSPGGCRAVSRRLRAKLLQARRPVARYRRAIRRGAPRKRIRRLARRARRARAGAQRLRRMHAHCRRANREGTR